MTMPVVRLLGERERVFDGLWRNLLDDIRRWRAEGAPFRTIALMILEDYRIDLDKTTVCRLHVGFSDQR